MINLYYAVFASLDEEKLIRDYRDKVDRERWTKVMRTRADKVRVRSLIAGYLLQVGIREFFAEKMQDKDRGSIPLEAEAVLPIQYRYTEQGKPYLADYPGIFFSISHSKDVAACAVADREIGMDVQAYVMGKERIAKRFFTKEEQTLLEEAKKEGRFEELFFSLWSIKESYLKYTGLGMKQGLDSFQIDFEKQRIIDSFKQTDEQKPVYFQQVRLAHLPEYAVSVCCDSEETEIAVRKIEI